MVRALDFCLRHPHAPVSQIVCDVFYTVYQSAVQGRERSFEDDSLFGFLDWDRGKQLRKRLVETFLRSAWPPGDVVIAAHDPTLIRKIVKRLLRRRGGSEFFDRVHADLVNRRDEPAAVRVLPVVQEIAGNPNFFEEWD
jgi:hypothetical protein